jgi:histidyl-tRNA synthetase
MIKGLSDYLINFVAQIKSVLSMPQKPSIPKGTRDFGPEQMLRRNYIFDKIKEVFIKYGYQPIETPAMETLETLMGKYGEEGDRLIFKILNSGHFVSKMSKETLEEICNSDETDPSVSVRMTAGLSEKALRYDLTVPFARYVVQHRNEINFPFKRYQLQPVWRADRPQKGRYREFYQCDVDVIGSDSLLNEVELIQIIDEIFSSLKTRVLIKINNRKVLAGIAEIIGHPDKITDITTAIDKIDKIGIDNVNAELIARGLPRESVEYIQPILGLEGEYKSQLSKLEEVLSESKEGLKGISELRTIFELIDLSELNSDIQLDLTLARGLDYYTGAIIEVKSLDFEIGSVCGGGRYDDLTGIFGLEGVSGVGVSFGADRIYDVLENTGRFPEGTSTSTQVLIMNFGAQEVKSVLGFAAALRKAGISAEVYPDDARMKKQMSYANSRNIPVVIIAGKDELDKGQVQLKNMRTGEQEAILQAGLVDRVISLLDK